MPNAFDMLVNQQYKVDNKIHEAHRCKYTHWKLANMILFSTLCSYLARVSGLVHICWPCR